MAEKSEGRLSADPLSENPKECLQRIRDEGSRYANLKKVDCNNLFLETVKSIRFVCISDTHSKHAGINDLPDGDILIHSGDFTMLGAEKEVEEFNTFLGNLKNKYKHIIVIAGNHEISFDKRKDNKSSIFMTFAKTYFLRSPFAKIPNHDQAKNLLTNCTYLENSSTELYGIKIYGSPWQPIHFDMAFCGKRGSEMMTIWNQIPCDTDILITHGPPLGIGDKVNANTHVGCMDLLSTVQDRVRPKFHIFGHIHEDHGIWTDGETLFINASVCNTRYSPVQSPIVFDYEIQNE